MSQSVPATELGDSPSEDDQVEMFNMMVLSRTYEEAILREYHADKGPGFDIGKGLIPGEMHLSAGQEPVAAALAAHLRQEDALTATHRPHHVAIAKGVDMKRMTAEIFGRTTGLGQGRGGHMHLFDPDTHFSCSGIVAEGIPPALGQAFAFQRRGTDNIAVAVIGEGAANSGAFHESLNLAALWKLPVVVIIEDNEWGISVPRSDSTAVPSNDVRGAAYGIPGVTVEDNDPDTVFAAVGDAVARARAGEGPSLIEVRTVRMWGHFEGDAQGYRPDAETVNERDPIPIYEEGLRAAGVLDDVSVKQAYADATNMVEEAIEFAKTSPIPDPADALKYVFTEES